jgi:hypothetical protein
MVPGKDLRFDNKRVTKCGGATGKEFVVEVLPRSTFPTAPKIMTHDLLLWVIPYQSSVFRGAEFQYEGPGFVTSILPKPPHQSIQLPPSTMWDTSPLQQVVVPNEEKADIDSFVANLSKAMDIPEDTWVYVAKLFRPAMEWRLLNSPHNKVKAPKKKQSGKQPNIGQYPYKISAGDIIAVITVPTNLQPSAEEQMLWAPWADAIPKDKMELTTGLEIAPWLAREEDWQGQEQAKMNSSKRSSVKWADDTASSDGTNNHKRGKTAAHRFVSLILCSVPLIAGPCPDAVATVI